MALLIYYNRVADGPDGVVYRFGETRNALDRTMTIDKANGAVHTDTPEDLIFRSAAARITLRCRRENSWPRSGVVAS